METKFNLKTNKAIKEIASGIEKNVKKLRPILNILKLDWYKIIATDSVKAYIVKTDEKRDWETAFSCNDIKISNELSNINGVDCTNFPDVETFFPSENDCNFKIGLWIDHLIDILKVYKKAGAKNIIMKFTDEKSPVLINDYKSYNSKTDLKDWLDSIDTILMPIKL